MSDLRQDPNTTAPRDIEYDLVPAAMVEKGSWLRVAVNGRWYRVRYVSEPDPDGRIHITIDGPGSGLPFITYADTELAVCQ